MIQSISPDRLDQRLDWAREQLGVAQGASLEAVRTRFFAVLERDNFVPDEGLDRAFRTLRWEAEGVIDAHDPPEFLAAEAQRLQEELEPFAAEMFSLPPAERRVRWSELYCRAQHAPQIRARLESLAAGLDADLHAVDGAGRLMHVKTLARYALELFPLRPTARAMRRHALLQTLYKDDVKPWRKAAQTLQKKHPQLAALAPEFLGQLAAAGTAPRVAKPVVAKRSSANDRPHKWALALAACIFVFFVVRAALQSGDSRRPPSGSAASNLDAEMERILEEVRRHQFPPVEVNPPGSLFPPETPFDFHSGRFPNVEPGGGSIPPFVPDPDEFLREQHEAMENQRNEWRELHRSFEPPFEKRFRPDPQPEMPTPPVGSQNVPNVPNFRTSSPPGF